MRPHSLTALAFLFLALYAAAFHLERQPGSAQARGRPFTVAAAADLQFAFTDLGKSFERETGQKVGFSFGSTGNLTRQIENGAPFDAFFAANEQFVLRLEEKGMLAPRTRRLYAIGRIVLASNRKSALEVNDLNGLLDPRIKRVAIANPEHAPYGFAAREALRKAGVWEKLQPKLVLGENIRQTLQFIQTGNAEAGIVALSVANVPEIRYRVVDNRLHSPLKQAVAVVRGSPNEATARRFIAYVLGKEGQAVMKKCGFLPPPGR
jgi:molybdate transport system substrate-binding protein